MKKNVIVLIVLVVVLAGAVGAFLLLRDDPAAADDAGEVSAVDEIYALGGIPQPFVKEVSIQNELDTYTVKNNFQNAIQQQNADADAPGYTIEGLPQEDINSTLLKSVMTACASLTAKQQVDAGSDLSAYGLDSPRATVDVTYEDSSAKMLIGDDAPGGEGTYAKVGDNVYLIATSRLSNMLLSRYGFVGKTITGGTSEQATFQKITLTGGKFGETPVVIEQADEQSEASAMMGMGSYLISAPIQAGLDLDKGITPLSALFGVTATEVVGDATGDDSQNLTPYGLFPPYMTAEVVSGDPEIGDFTLSVSQPDAEGNVFVRSSEKTFVYQLAADSLPWMELDLFTLREKMVILPHIDSVSEVEVVVDDQVYLFTLEGEGDELKATVNGNELDAANFRKFYQTLIAASYDSEVEAQASGTDAEAEAAAESETTASTDGGEDDSSAAAAEEDADTASAQVPGEGEVVKLPEPGGDYYPIITNTQPADPPMLTYTYRYRDGKTPDVVKFWSASARKYYVALNDGPIYYAKSVYVDRVLEDLPKVAAGEEVKSYL